MQPCRLLLLAAARGGRSLTGRSSSSWGQQQQVPLATWQLLQRAPFSTRAATPAAAAEDSLPDGQEVRAAYGHCAQLVREHDPDNFLWVVQLPQELRRRVLALRAFNLETMLIGEQVKSREPIVTQIRFQWWRDALSALSASSPPPKHPTLIALWDALCHSSSSSSSSSSSPGSSSSPSSSTVSSSSPSSSSSVSSRASIYKLKRILDAREADQLTPQPPLTLEDLEGYAEGTASQLLYLQLAAAGIVSREADHAASHLGKAVGIALLLRGMPFHASRRRSYLPLELCAAHGVSQEDLYRGGGDSEEGLRDVVLAVASAAVAHLREGRSLLGGLPRGAAPVLQQATLAGLYLDALERAGFDIFDAQLASSGGVSPLRRVLALKWATLRGTV